MPRTSTAERHNYRCPLCDQPLAPDLDHEGWVRHKKRPDIEPLLADPAKSGVMSEEDKHYLRFLGLCPFERGQKDDVEPVAPRYQYLGPWHGSNYRQYFLKDRKIRAETLYRGLIGPEPMTPGQVAEDYDVPVDAVYEAVDYCEHNAELLRQEREADHSHFASLESERPSAVPAKT
jgi:hypothetical protein